MKTTDRIKFYTHLLSNGHYLHTHKMDSALTEVHIVTQLGNIHSNNQIQFMNTGWVHFLEHICFERSKKHPNKNFYKNKIQQSGAYQNAAVYDYFTDFYLISPTSTFFDAIPHFIDHIAYPVFSQKDIELQKSIIKNEKAQQKYFPGIDELTLYLRTKWMFIAPASKEQVFGTKDSLELITPKKLSLVHKNYFTKPVHIYIGGKFDLKKTISLFELLPPINKQNKQKVTNEFIPSWVNKAFHKFKTNDVELPVLFFGSFNQSWTIEELWGVSFILELLCDSDTGILQKWIRHDNGWSYGVDITLEFSNLCLAWQLKISLNNEKNGKEIREKIHSKIFASIKNEKIISLSKNAQQLQKSFSFETLSERMDYAVIINNSLGKIPNEQQHSEWLNSVTSKSLIPIYDKFFSKENVGEFLAVPKK